jgi:hypothetical protein
MSTQPNLSDDITVADSKHRHTHEPETVPIEVVDPSSTIDPQTGAVIEKKDKTERLFVARLDAILLVYCCVSQVLK